MSAPEAGACPQCGQTGVTTVRTSVVFCRRCNREFVEAGASQVALTEQETTAGGGEGNRVVTLLQAFTDRFELGEILGRGGCGVVVQAKDLHLNRPVAVKFLTLAGSLTIFERMVREAQALADISHPNVVKLFDVYQMSDSPVLILELMEGGSLRDRLKRPPPLMLAATVTILVDVLQGLAACHDAGVVHRDIKPENILFSAQGVPKIADLGIARVTGNQALTVAGHVMGTPRYMAPEQTMGLPVDHRADLYSVGVMLYEMAAGRPPFTGDTINDLLEAQRNRVPERVIGVPDGLADLIGQVLEKDPARRPATARAFADALAATKTAIRASRRIPLRQTGKAVPAPTPVVLKDRAWGLWLLGFAILLVAAAGIALRSRPVAVSLPRAPVSTPRPLPSPKDMHRWFDPPRPPRGPHLDCYGYPLPRSAIARLGGRKWRQTRLNGVGFTADHNTLVTYGPGPDVRFWHIPTESLVLTYVHAGGFTDAHKSVVSDDRRRLIQSSYDAIRAWDVATDKLVWEVPLRKDVSDLAVSHKSHQMVVITRAGSCHRFDSDTGQLWGSWQTASGPLPSLGARFQVAISPDGQWAASWGADLTVTVWNIAEDRSFAVYEFRQPLIVLPAPVFTDSRRVTAAFSQDSSRLVLATNWGQVEVRSLKDGRTLARLDRPATGACIAPGARYVALRQKGPASDESNFSVIDTASGEYKRAVFTGVRGQFIELSGDGQKLAACYMNGAITVHEEARVPRTAPGHRRLLNCVRFSPDGRRVVTSAGDPHCVEWDASTGIPERVMVVENDHVLVCEYSPDGEYIATAHASGKARIWRRPGGELLRVIETGLKLPDVLVFSPDGRKLAVRGAAGHSVGIWYVESGRPVGEWPKLHDAIGGLHFAADGTTLALAAASGIQYWDWRTGQFSDRIRLDSGIASRTLVDPGYGARMPRVLWGPGDEDVFWFEHGNAVPLVRHWKLMRSGAAVSSKTIEGSGGRRGSTGLGLGAERGTITADGRFALSADGKTLACLEVNNVIGIFNAVTGEQLRQISVADAGPVLALALSPKGDRLVTGGLDGIGTIWTLRSSQER